MGNLASAVFAGKAEAYATSPKTKLNYGRLTVKLVVMV